jgi:transcriptional regulator with XRE-family HTH domain
VFNPKPVKFWTPHPKQAQAVKLAGEVFELLFGGSAGPGKGGRTPDRTAPGYTPDQETKILTPKGWTLFGDIKVGDTVCNPDGTTATVIKVTDNGPKQFYRVTLADGSTVEADDEHLWAVSIAGQRKRRKIDPPAIPKGLRPEDEWNLRVQSRAKVVNTVELARLVARADDEKARGLRPHYVQLPLTNPVTMTGVGTQWATFSPYTLGALVGDGSISVNVSICGVDPEIFDRIRAELPHGLELRQVTGTDNGAHCPTYSITRPGADRDDRDALAEFTATMKRWRKARNLGQRELGALIGSPQGTIGTIERGTVWPRPATAQRLDDALNAGGELVAAYPKRTGESAATLLKRDGLYGLHSWEKFIPGRIMRAPTPDRLAFVQGLMDTDGHIDDRGHVEFVTVSERLAKDMQAILRSLGYRATLNTKTTTYTHGGEKRAGRLAYRLYIQGRATVDLFHMPRKRARAVAGFNGGDHEPWHRVVSVVPTVVDNSRCITVDNLNHLYVTDDYIVTHNSFFLRSYACDFAVAHPGAHIALVRRTLPMLKQTHGLHLPGMLAGHARENKTDFTFTFPNASVIRFISLQNAGSDNSPGDEQNYKSAEFDLLLFDELTEFTESQYTFMLSRVRSARGHRAHVISASNPEGVGFRWVKRRFVSPRPEDLAKGQAPPDAGVPWSPPVVEDGKVIGWHPKRAFLPATIEDNPGLMKSNPGYVAQLRAMPDSRLRRALLDGDWDAMDAIPGALWSQDVIDAQRVGSVPPDVRLVRVVVGVDPSGSSTNGKSECGIVVVGLGSDGRFYVLEDLSGSWSPTEWADRVYAAYEKHTADAICAEINFGGEMVEATIKAAHPNLPVTVVRASRGKAVRAEPIAVLTQRKMVRHVGRWSELEDQLCTWNPTSGWSPDRLDAFVWAVTELAGGASALAFLTQLSAPCPECKTPNTTGRATCFRCGKELPHAAPTGPAALPVELRPDGPPGVPGSIPIPNDPGDTPDTPDAPDVPGPITTAPDGTVTIAGLILPGR